MLNPVSSLSPTKLALFALVLIAVIQFGGLFIFLKGFLLTRVALTAQSQDASLTPKFKRAIVLVIDALRYDFLFPHQNATQVFHNILHLPAQLSREQPEHAFMAKFIADPPTTTLQRIKGLTVGTLPTFVDAGNNFNGQSIQEDNWLFQARQAGKKIAFAGDDTWLSTYPTGAFAVSESFDPHMSWPYDSFNVEDLDTVDHGVRRHLYPLLDDPNASWDIFVGHCLGLDHVGHRLGSKHPEMKRKLQEANDMVARVIASLREDDLFVLMGDHGMDVQGNHGGDSPEEVSAGLWMYSRKPLVSTADKQFLHNQDVFVHDGIVSRVVQQLSFTPTFSLLLGLPIPFSNLGSIIPEMFIQEKHTSTWKGTDTKLDHSLFTEATRLNVRQIKTFLDAYYSEALLNQLPDLYSLYDQFLVETHPIVQSRLAFELMRQIQAACRSAWATFNRFKMAAGLSILAGSLFAILRLANLARYEGSLFRGTPLRVVVGRGYLAYAVGLVAGVPIALLSGVPILQALLASASFSSTVALLWPARVHVSAPLATPSESSWSDALLSLVALVHAGALGSNSFVMWEDRISLYLVQIPLFLLAVHALAAPLKRFQYRIGLLAILAMVCARLMSVSTICREEQQPYCTATFYLPTSFDEPYAHLALGASLICAIVLPTIAAKFLDFANANQGIAPYYFQYGFRGCLVLGWLYWAIEWAIGVLPPDQAVWSDLLTALKNGAALSLYTAVAGIVVLIWYAVGGLNLGLGKEEIPASGAQEARTRIQLIGFANSLGSTYLVLFSNLFSLLFLLAQPVGQIALALGFIAILSVAEALDSRNDVRLVVKQIEDPQGVVSPTRPPAFGEMVIVVLLGNLLFYATGHQAVLSSLQWKVAFAGVQKVVYPLSPILIALNTLGPYVLSAAAVPFLVFWNVSPSIKGGPALPLVRHLFRACLLFMLYHTLLAVHASLFAAWHRRHLMVWKVFAPRFMLGGATLLAANLATILVAYLGGVVVLQKASRTLGGHWS